MSIDDALKMVMSVGKISTKFGYNIPEQEPTVIRENNS